MLAWSVEGNYSHHDGGAMFGNAPRTLWQQWLPPDEDNRIRFAGRGLVVDNLNGLTVLFEAGVGTFFEPKLRSRFGIVESRNRLTDSLSLVGFSEQDIDVIVLSHLHFDHAGGLLTDWRDGQEPELRFPNARFLVGARHWERACRPHPRDRASFIPRLQALLEDSQRLELIDGDRAATLGDAVRFQFSDGHTPGLMLSVIGGDGGLAFCSDLIPARPWVHLPITMGFDRSPERLIDEKKLFLDEMVRRSIRLVFTHDPECAMATPAINDEGRYHVTDAYPQIAGLKL